MANVKLNRNCIEQSLGKTLSEAELQQISMMGTPFECVEGSDLHIEIFPNRPDLFTEQGFSRALSSFLGIKTGLASFTIKKGSQQVLVDKSVEQVRPYTACCIVRNLSCTNEMIKELMQVQEKLHTTFGRNRKKLAIGIYPLDKITFPITYTAKNPKDIVFVPLGSKKEMSAQDILMQHPMGKEYAHLLTNLPAYPLFIDLKKQILSMPPIINSDTVGRVNTSTKDVFIEVSGFTFEDCSVCLNIIATALHDTKAVIESVDVIYSDTTRTTPQVEPRKMQFDKTYAEKRLGITLTEKTTKDLLEKMGFSYEKGTVQVPCYRVDIMHPIDIVEDIAIAYGYDNFEPLLPEVSTIAESAPFEVFKKRVVTILIGAGLLEMNSYHLTNKTTHTTNMRSVHDPIPLANALTPEYNSLRTSLLPNMMDILSRNKHHDYPQHIFEAGVVFSLGASETGLIEDQHLAITLAGPDEDFTRIKQILDLLMRSLDMKYTTIAQEHPSFIPGRSSAVLCASTAIGVLGEVHPQVITSFFLSMPVCALEINLSELWRKRSP